MPPKARQGDSQNCQKQNNLFHTIPPFFFTTNHTNQHEQEEDSEVRVRGVRVVSGEILFIL
jgi:hypothetical protein